MQTGGDAGLEIRLPIQAGPRTVGVAFVRELWEPEGLPQPLQRGRVLTNDQIYMDYAAVGSVQIGGPYRIDRPAVDTPSRRAIFVCKPAAGADEHACATNILSRIARLAYRRPVTPADVRTLLAFFDDGRRDGGNFDAGIQFALERVLVDPDFLLRVHRDPSGRTASASAYRLSDLDVASQLSFFLWSSIPDRTPARPRRAQQLTTPAVLEQEVKRMLADPRAPSSLVDDFAAQWLNLRRIGEVVVHPDSYPSFDDSLLDAFKQETELFVGSTGARRPQRAGSIARELHVRQRAPRAPLQDPGHLRQPVPPGRADQPGAARRPAGARLAAGDHVVSGSDVPVLRANGS
jgi:hypothetical protein